MRRRKRTVRRVVGVLVLLCAVAVVGVVLLQGGDPYVVKARFENASQLVKGNLVQVAGTGIGEVRDLRLTDDGQAEVTLAITDREYAPLRRGTLATVRQASLSGVANRYVDLRLPSGDPPPIEEGGVIEATETTSAVELDQLFNTFDERTRRSLSGVLRGFGRQYAGQSEAANRGWAYLNPSLASASRLFEELNRDTPLLQDFVVSSSRLMTDLAERRDDLAGLVDELATTTGAIGREREALADAIDRLPPFMRRANTTFVDLRAALRDLEPLVDDSKPVARKLRPFFRELRPLARDARPTLRDLSRLVRSPGDENDLLELTRSLPAVRDIAVRDVERNGRTREGAFPATAKALGRSIEPLAYARPYAVELTGWFDDFGHSGVYDALGGKSRVGTYVNAYALLNNVLTPVPPALRDEVFKLTTQVGHRNRCPGAADVPAADRSNPWRPTQDHNCDPSQRLPGP